jgi:hypothetical protein
MEDESSVPAGIEARLAAYLARPRPPSARSVPLTLQDVPQVSRVLLRIEWADGRIREIDAEDPYGLDVEIRRPHMPLETPLAPVAIYSGEAIGVAVSFKAGMRHPVMVREVPETVTVSREDLRAVLAGIRVEACGPAVAIANLLDALREGGVT